MVKTALKFGSFARFCFAPSEEKHIAGASVFLAMGIACLVVSFLLFVLIPLFFHSGLFPVIAGIGFVLVNRGLSGKIRQKN